MYRACQREIEMSPLVLRSYRRKAHYRLGPPLAIRWAGVPTLWMAGARLAGRSAAPMEGPHIDRAWISTAPDEAFAAAWRTAGRRVACAGGRIGIVALAREIPRGSGCGADYMRRADPQRSETSAPRHRRARSKRRPRKEVDILACPSSCPPQCFVLFTSCSSCRVRNHISRRTAGCADLRSGSESGRTWPHQGSCPDCPS